MAAQRLFTKDFIIDMLISTCGALSYFALIINIAGYATSTFGATSAEAGLAVGIYVIGGLISRIFIGKYVELVGRKKMLIIGMACATIMTASYLAVSSLLMLYIVRFVHGMTYGVNSTCTTDIVSKLIPSDRRGEGLGYFFLSATISTAIGPFLGLSLSAGGHYEPVFIVCTVAYAVSLILSFFLKVPEEKLTEEEKAAARSFSLKNLLQFSAIPLALVCAVFYFAYSGIHAFIASYSEGIGLAVAATYFYLAVAAGTLISRFTTGKIYDRNGPNKILTAGFLSFIISMLVFSQTDNVVVFLASGFFIGYGISIVYAVCQAIVISKSTPQRYGVTTSTFAAMVDLGTGIGPLVLGLLIPFLGYRDMYVTCAIIGLVSLILYWTLFGFKVRKHTA